MKKYKIRKINETKLIGSLLIITFIIPILNWVFVLSNFVKKDLSYFISHLEMFSFNIIVQLVYVICLLLLTSQLFHQLRFLNDKKIVFTTLIKIAEAFINIIFILLHCLILIFLTYNLFHEHANVIFMKQFIFITVDNYIPLTSLSGIFFGLNMFLYTILLRKAQLIEKYISYFALLAYSFVIIYDIMFILIPHFTSHSIVKILFTAPVCFAQIALAINLIVKKNNIKQEVLI